MFKRIKKELIRMNEEELLESAKDAYQSIVVEGKKYNYVNKGYLLDMADFKVKHGEISEEFYHKFTEEVKSLLPDL